MFGSGNIVDLARSYGDAISKAHGVGVREYLQVPYNRTIRIIFKDESVAEINDVSFSDNLRWLKLGRVLGQHYSLYYPSGAGYGGKYGESTTQPSQEYLASTIYGHSVQVSPEAETKRYEQKLLLRAKEAMKSMEGHLYGRGGETQVKKTDPQSKSSKQEKHAQNVKKLYQYRSNKNKNASTQTSSK